MTSNANQPKRVILAAGGTGGHIMPALAVAAEIQRLAPDVEVVFVGTGKEIERKLIGGGGYRLLELVAMPARGKGIGGKVKLLFALPRMFWGAVRTLRRERCSGFMAFGGYPAFMPAVAAWILGHRVLLQEQNVQVGLANRVVSLFASRIFAVPGARGFWRTGRVQSLPNPVRNEFLKIPPVQTPTSSPFHVLVLGGSQGAVTVNDLILDLVPLFQELGISLSHQTGANDFERVQAEYAKRGFANVRVFPFSNEMAKELARAHLVICRAGAMTVAEVCAAGRAAVYIPLRISGAHQFENVTNVVNAGAAFALQQDETVRSKLQQIIRDLHSDLERIKSMGRAARELAHVHGENPATVMAEMVLVTPQV